MQQRENKSIRSEITGGLQLTLHIQGHPHRFGVIQSCIANLQAMKYFLLACFLYLIQLVTLKKNINYT